MVIFIKKNIISVPSYKFIIFHILLYFAIVFGQKFVHLIFIYGPNYNLTFIPIWLNFVELNCVLVFSMKIKILSKEKKFIIKKINLFNWESNLKFKVTDTTLLKPHLHESPLPAIFIQAIADTKSFCRE